MSAPYKITRIGDLNEWYVTSSEGNQYRIVEKRGGGLRCSCPGYKYRQDCRHIRMDLDYTPPKRFPRSTIASLGPALLGILVQGERKAEIVGSFRRGKSDSKDIDIIVQAPLDWWTHKFLVRLQVHSNIVIQSQGEIQVRGVYNGVPFDVSRVDDEDDWIWYLLYRTGSKDTNIMMRKHARDLGWKMNEHGLFHADGSREPFWPDTEEKVFAKLGIAYLTPEER